MERESLSKHVYRQNLGMQPQPGIKRWHAVLAVALFMLVLYLISPDIPRYP